MPEEEQPSVSFALEDLSKQLSSDESNVWNAWSLLSANVSSYPPETVRLLANAKERLASAFLAGETKRAAETLKEAIRQIQSLPIQNQPTQTQRNVSVMSENELLAHAENLTLLQKQAGTAIKDIHKNQLEAKRPFVHSLVEHWIDQSYKNLAPDQQALQSATVKDPATRNSTIEAITDQIIKETLNDPSASPEAVIAAVRASSDASIQPVLSEKTQRVVTTALSSEQNRFSEFSQKAAELTITSPDPKKTLDALAHAVEVAPNESVEKITAKAEGLTRAAISLGSSPQTQELAKDAFVGGFFSAIAQTPFQKLVAPIADAATAVFGNKAELIDRLHLSALQGIDVAIRSLEKNTERLTQLFGERIVSDSFFRHQIQQTISSSLQTGSVTTKARGVFDDLWASIFRTPMDEAAGAYLWAIRQKPGGTASPLVSSIGFFDTGGRLIQWGVAGAQNRAIGLAAKNLGKGLFAKIAKVGLVKGLFSFAGGLFAGPVGTGIALLASDALRFIGSALTGLFTFIPNTLNRLISGGGKSSWQKDLPLLLALGGILIIIIVPTFMSSFADVARSSTLISPIEEGGEVGSPDLETSPFINVSLTADKYTIQNSALPTSVQFTLTITATTNELTNIHIANVVRLITKSGSQEITTAGGQDIRNPIPPKDSLKPGESMTLTFTIPITSQDSLLLFSSMVTATVEGNTEVTAVQTRIVIGSPQVYGSFACTDAGNRIVAPGATEHLLTLAKIPETRKWCITPTMIVIHWSGGYANDQGNLRTYEVLESRGVSCQFGTDTVGVWQMLPMWEKKSLLAYCVGGNYNNMALSNEIAGVYFDTNPPPENEIQMAVENTCFLMRQYNIPLSQIYGHYQLRAKPDPGKEFLKKFIERVEKTCGG